MEGISLVTNEVSITMPRVYKDFLVQKRRWYSSVLLIIGVIVVTGIYILSRLYGRGHRIDVIGTMIHIIPAFFGLFAWCLMRRKDWIYKIDDNGFSLIWWQWGTVVWNWHYLAWKRDVVFSVNEDEWRGLPTLCLNTQIKPHKQLQKLVMVYAHEDAEKVRTQVLPLIEQYRRQYRHELWADRLRS